MHGYSSLLRVGALIYESGYIHGRRAVKISFGYMHGELLKALREQLSLVLAIVFFPAAAPL